MNSVAAPPIEEPTTDIAQLVRVVSQIKAILEDSSGWVNRFNSMSSAGATVSSGGAISAINQTAIAAISGAMSASASFRVQAGNAVSLLDLFVSNDPGSSVSVAKISAANIILDGTVTASHMNVTSLSAVSAVIGTLSSGIAGQERLVIKDDVIAVYDANNVARMKLGNLV